MMNDDDDDDDVALSPQLSDAHKRTTITNAIRGAASIYGYGCMDVWDYV